MLSFHMLPSWNEFGVEFANHLWQSTVFVISVGALTLLFGRNRAVIRYRLWLIASVKFLVPFSLFAGLGGLLEWVPVHPVAPSPVPVVVRQLSQPFTSAPATPPTVSISTVAPVVGTSSGVALAAVWLGGAAIVLLVWFVRWMQLVRIVRSAEPLDLSISWIPSHSKSQRLRILSSVAAAEPGVFGILRPALLLPENIVRNLSSAQLKAVIAHEVFHMRGRDNLAAAIHTIVQALFWFHPLVWWVGNRLIDERERACDEAVLQAGHEPTDYAEGILKVCKSNVATPACMAGVSGSNLKKRIEAIMENRAAKNLSSGKKLLLTFAGLGILVVPVFAGMISAAQVPVVVVREIQLPVIEKTTSAGLPVISQAPAPANRQTPPAPPNPLVPAATLPVIASATSAGLPVLLQTPAPPPVQVASGLQKWLNDVSIIITDMETKAFQRLTKDSERQGFITNFWLARDPTPGTPANEFRDEYNRRVAYTNEHFTTQSGIPGSKTDRGKMYILNGPPDAIHSKPARTEVTTYAGATSVIRYPALETWHYRRVEGNGDNLVYEFVDKQSNGNYALEYDPAAKLK